MFGKIIGGFAGSKIAKSTSGIGGATGTLLGVGAATIAKRLSIPALVAVTAGGYLVKKYMDRKDETPTSDKAPNPVINRTPPEVEPAIV
ncbi:hypothetical protein [Pontixanthobacter luteolus]|uniref:hypothetical protein n=1 Tax=Pontixanthobacter luteolus TaxID=295089 RepID=UPI001926398C|nr:hypothetical protein [Pontixanthobacter luteolus]